MNHRRGLLAALAIVALLAASPAWAQDTGTEETFDGPLGDGWETSPAVTVIDGRLVVPPAGFAFRGGGWSEITLYGLSYSGDGEIVFDYAAGEATRYTLHFLQDRIWLLEKTDATGRTELGVEEDFPLNQDQDTTIEIGLSADGHLISIDGETILSAPDESPLSPGGFAIHSTGNRTVTVDGISLVGWNTPPTPDPDPATPLAGDASAEPSVAANEVTAPAAPTTTTIGPASDSLSARLDEFFSINTLGYGVGEAAVNLALAAALAFVLGRVYIHWGAGLSNRRRFAANFMVVAVATTFIILVVRSSVALSLGLVGALSIVRFRAAIKDPEELTYMFLAIGIGIGLGDNQRLLTMIALGTAIVVIGLLHLLRESGTDFNLHVTVTGEGTARLAPDTIQSALTPHCKRIRLSRFEDTPSSSESSFMVEFAGDTELHAARQALLDLAPETTVTFLDDKGLW